MEPSETSVPNNEADFESGEVEAEGEFDQHCWDIAEQKYGLMHLLRCRWFMLPIEKPQETAHLKFLICPSYGQDGGLEDTGDPRDMRSKGPERKGKGKGRDRFAKGGRFVPEMGKTEPLMNTQKGQWWRNIGADNLDVIVRDSFSLMSQELWKVPPGHYVQQGGPAEVFVNGQAQGLVRMPVLPRGWVTVDAVSVGGPKYLETVRLPRWKVCFKSGSHKGDIVVRGGVSLESEEVAVLLCGTVVEQGGPQECLEDGIIRMPIGYPEGVGREPSSPSQAPKVRQGWVTCDATAQGGPKFFEPCPEELEKKNQEQAPVEGAPAAPDAAEGRAPVPTHSSYKERLWKVVNVPPEEKVWVTNRSEPFAPGTGRVPPEDIIVKYLVLGDEVIQSGHSKKMRGYMVMPVQLSEGGEGWVTRRIVDKKGEHQEVNWFEEIGKGDADGDPAEHRRTRRQKEKEARMASQAAPADADRRDDSAREHLA